MTFQEKALLISKKFDVSIAVANQSVSLLDNYMENGCEACGKKYYLYRGKKECGCTEETVHEYLDQLVKDGEKLHCSQNRKVKNEIA
ncbi:MAG: hypothetical protein ACW980_24140 [Promethearchaeota archaeon]|jgi:hypothetical protein